MAATERKRKKKKGKGKFQMTFWVIEFVRYGGPYKHRCFSGGNVLRNQSQKEAKKRTEDREASTDGGKTY